MSKKQSFEDQLQDPKLLREVKRRLRAIPKEFKEQFFAGYRELQRRVHIMVAREKKWKALEKKAKGKTLVPRAFAMSAKTARWLQQGREALEEAEKRHLENYGVHSWTGKPSRKTPT